MIDEMIKKTLKDIIKDKFKEFEEENSIDCEERDNKLEGLIIYHLVNKYCDGEFNFDLEDLKKKYHKTGISIHKPRGTSICKVKCHTGDEELQRLKDR